MVSERELESFRLTDVVMLSLSLSTVALCSPRDSFRHCPSDSLPLSSPPPGTLIAFSAGGCTLGCRCRAGVSRSVRRACWRSPRPGSSRPHTRLWCLPAALRECVCTVRVCASRESLSDAIQPPLWCFSTTTLPPNAGLANARGLCGTECSWKLWHEQ